MIYVVPLYRRSENEMKQAISDLQERDYQLVSEIIPITNGQALTVTDDKTYAFYYAKMQKEVN